jgi:hypothetical protein
MERIATAKPSKVFMGRLPFGRDLLRELFRLVRSREVRLGRIEALGAVQQARLAYFDQVRKDFEHLYLEQAMEIVQLTGTVAVQDGEPAVHAHISLSDSEGRVYGGRLAAGTEIYACEYILLAYDGEEVIRSYDEETGLELWF